MVDPRDVRAALESIRAVVPPGGDGWFTMREMCAAVGHTHQWVIKRLDLLAARGMVEYGMVPRESRFGIVRPTPVYRVKGGGVCGKTLTPKSPTTPTRPIPTSRATRRRG